MAEDAVVLAGAHRQAVEAPIVTKQEFAGYWEYLLDEAIFTAPLPAGVDAGGKYSASCASMIALLRYGCGMPFDRLDVSSEGPETSS